MSTNDLTNTFCIIDPLWRFALYPGSIDQSAMHYKSMHYMDLCLFLLLLHTGNHAKTPALCRRTHGIRCTHLVRRSNQLKRIRATQAIRAAVVLMAIWVVRRWASTHVSCWRHRSCSDKSKGAKIRKHRPSSIHKTTQHWPCPQTPKGPTGRTCHPRLPSSLALTDFKALKRAGRSTPEGRNKIIGEEFWTFSENIGILVVDSLLFFFFFFFFNISCTSIFLIHNYGPAIQCLHVVWVSMCICVNDLNVCPSID